MSTGASDQPTGEINDSISFMAGCWPTNRLTFRGAGAANAVSGWGPSDPVQRATWVSNALVRESLRSSRETGLGKKSVAPHFIAETTFIVDDAPETIMIGTFGAVLRRVSRVSMPSESGSMRSRRMAEISFPAERSRVIP